MHTDFENKIFYVSFSNLNRKMKKLLSDGKISVWDINYHNIYCRQKQHYEHLKKKGFSMVFTHNGVNVLLYFNRDINQYYRKPVYGLIEM